MMNEGSYLSDMEHDEISAENVPAGTVARIGYDPDSGLWELWEYGLRQSSTFDSIQQLADYLRDYPQQLLFTTNNPPPRE